MPTVYVDSDDLKVSLTLDGTTFADTDVDAACIAASGAIEEVQGRDYGRSDEDEIRFFTPTDWEVLTIDDLVELTTLRVDRGDGTFETWTVDTDFRVEPLNAEGKGRPFTSLRAMAQRFPCARLARVEVTGIFGWPAPPQQIIEAASIIAAQLVKRKRDAPFGVLNVGDVAAYIVRNDPMIAQLLNGLSRRPIFGSMALS
jgi:hypothetical protein